jgi:N-acetylneuraminic acid mutarotase
MRFPTLFVISVLLLSTLSGSINYHSSNGAVLAQNNSPDPRYLPAIAYDSINERIMLFGGGYENSALGDTWIFEYGTGTWTQLDLSTSPTPRHSAVMVYDPIDDVIILFGGNTGVTIVRDTWVFNCSSQVWTEMTPAISPSGRMSHAMTYDAANERAIVFSGYGAGGPTVNDTWAYDYSTNTWEEMSPVMAPHARYGAAFTYDNVNESMIIFGGNSNGYFSDTWSYNYKNDTWTEFAPITHPQALKWSCMTYDSTIQKSILFGGNDVSLQSVNDTWVYDSVVNQWEEQSPAKAPSTREAFGFVYDSLNERAILFGGFQVTNNEYPTDTWAYDYETNTWEDISPVSGMLPIDPLVIIIVIPIITTVFIIGYILSKKRRLTA